MHGDIREQGDARLRESPPDEMERRQCDQSIAQASKAVNHDSLELAEVAIHGCIKWWRLPNAKTGEQMEGISGSGSFEPRMDTNEHE